MDRKSISIFGFTIISVILFLILFSAVIPAGKKAKTDLDTNVSQQLDNAQRFTEQESNTVYYNLTIDFVYSDGTVVQKYSTTFKDGEKYYVVSPTVEGYIPEITHLEGVIHENLYYKIKYLPK